ERKLRKHFEAILRGSITQSRICGPFMIQSETQETADSLFAITTLAGEADRLFYPVCKCVLDVSVSTLLVVLLFPLLILLAILIKLDSSGPVIYLQQRVGSRRRKRRGRLTTWEIRTFPF